MGYDYVVTLSGQHARQTAFVGFLLSLFALVFFGFVLLQWPFATRYYLIFPLVPAGAIITQYYRLRKKEPALFRWWLFATAACWLFMPFLLWLSIAFVVCGLIEGAAAAPGEIRIDAGGIAFHHLYTKRHPWQALQRALLKDGILTLDFKNNRLFQQEIARPGEIAEADFNAYCREKIVNLPQ